MSLQIKDTCAERQYATCTFYETELPAFSLLTDDCITIEETTAEQYDLIGKIRGEIDLTSLGASCITYTLVSGKLLVKNALLAHQTKICALESLITAQNATIVSMQAAILALQNTPCP